jgi:PEP-CTERM motif
VITLLIALLGGFVTSTPARASLVRIEELSETVLHLQNSDGMFLVFAYGVSDPAALTFTISADETARTFTYLLTSGQSFNGAPISLNVSGGYNTGLGIYEWSGVGDVAGQQWLVSGSAAWLGDPVVHINDKYTDPKSKEEYTITGDGDVDTTDTKKGVSKGTFKATRKSDKKEFTGDGTDRYNSERQGYIFESATFFDPNDSKAPPIKMDIREEMLPVGGPDGAWIGSSDLFAQQIPEPSTFVLLGAALLGITGAVHRREKKRPDPLSFQS